MTDENKSGENKSGKGDTRHDAKLAPEGLARWRDDMRVVIGFLTRLPVGNIDHARGLADAAWAFPVAGVIVGGFGAAVLHIDGIIGLPIWCGSFLAIAVMTLVTGALHEDGLADVADGFGGGAVATRKLEIMRDSRIGSYGVLALIFSVGLRVAALSAFVRPDLAAAVLMSSAILSRATLPAMMHVLPMARDDGLAHGAGRPTQATAGVSLALGAGAALFILQPHLMTVLIVLSAAAAGAAAIAILAKRQIGGQTGDVIGAAQQVSETAVLLTAAAMLT